MFGWLERQIRKFKRKRELLERQNNLRLEKLKYDDKEEETSLYFPSFFGLFGYSKETVIKSCVKVNDSRLVFLDGNEFEWIAPPDKVKKLVRFGQGNPQALTAQCIKAIGQYRLKSAERAVWSGIISDKHAAKMAITEVTQTRIGYLESIEQIINAYEPMVSREANFNRVINALDEYIKTLEGQVRNGSELDREISKISRYDLDAQSNLQEYLKTDAELAKGVKDYFIKAKELGRDANWLKTKGSYYLRDLMKHILFRTMRQGQSYNQNICYSYEGFSWLRGDLNSYFEDGVKVVESYQWDLHNPVLPDHQYSFEGNAASVNSKELYGTNRDEIERLLLAIDFVEEQEHFDDETLSVTHGVKWRNMNSRYYQGSSFFRTFGSLLAFTINLFLQPFNLFEAIIWGSNASYFAELMTQVSCGIDDYCKKEQPEAETGFYAWQKKLDLPNNYFSTQLGLLIHRLFRNLFWDWLAMGIYRAIRRAFLTVWKLFVSDFYDGFFGRLIFETKWNEFRDDRNKKSIWTALDKLLNGSYELNAEERAEKLVKRLIEELDKQEEIDKECVAELKEIVDLTDQQYGAETSQNNWIESSQRDTSEITQSIPVYPLTPYHSHGLLNTATNGFIAFIDVFEDNIYAKHPFTAAVATALYLAGGLAAIPKTAALMPVFYAKFSHILGILFSKAPSTLFVSSGFTQFQMGTAVMEGLMNGPESFAGSALKTVARDPLTIAASIGIAYTIGYIVLYKIPYLGTVLSEENGVFQQGTPTLVGLKLAVGVYEILSEEIRKKECSVKDVILRIRKLHEKHKVNLSETQINSYNDLVGELLDTGKAEYLKTFLQKNELNLSSEGNLYFLMLTHRDQLPHLSRAMRRDLREMIRKTVKDPQQAEALIKATKKQTDRSTASIFVNHILSYLGLTVRCALTIFTWNDRPWHKLGKKIYNDFVSTTNALTNFTKKPIEMLLNRIPRMLGDIFFNEIIARAESYFRGDRHDVSKMNHGFSSQCNHGKELLEDYTTNLYMEPLRRTETQPATNPILLHEVERHMGIFPKPKVEVGDRDQQQTNQRRVLQNP